MAGLFYLFKRIFYPYSQERTLKQSLKKFIGICFLGTVFASHPVFAETLGPGWIMGKADPVSPQDASVYFKQKRKDDIFRWRAKKGKYKKLRLGQAPKPKDFAIEATDNITVMADSDADAATILTDEITELARALQHDPKLIYEYVRNHIDYTPYFGSLKGATLTYLDGSGNDFDQASLMIALLRASGYPASYEYGNMTIPGYQLANWVGVGLSTAVVYDVFGCGGIPIAILGGSEALVSRVWVKANIEGVDYRFDPALKSYIDTSKIDIGGSIDYNRADLLAAVSSGATVTGDYIQNLNEEALSDKLIEYSSNLVDTIRGEYPNRTVEEIVGGRSIIEKNLDDYQAVLPLPTTLIAVWDEVPTEYTATLHVEHVGIDYTFYLPEIAGKRLTVIYAGADNHPELRLDGELVVAGGATTLGSKYDLVLTINHPYAAGGGAYADQTSTYDMKSGAVYTLISAFSGDHDTVLTKRQKLLDDYRAQGLAEDSEQVLGESLNIMGLTWLKEAQLVTRLAADITDFVATEHHCVGRMSQEDSYYIDVKNWFYAWSPKFDIDADRNSACRTSYAIASALEHGVLEQTMGADIPGASTVKLLQIANSNGDKVFYVTSVNFASIRPQLQNYSSETLDKFQTELNSDPSTWLILPQDARIVLNQWQGVGYIQKLMQHGEMRMSWDISGSLNGGRGTEFAFANADIIERNSWWSFDWDESAWAKEEYACDPVDMASGGFIHERSDLSLGGKVPLGLTFSRSYSSSLNQVEKTLGYGWTHNYDIYLQSISHSDPALGRRQPVEAASLITALYVTHDLLANQDDITGWMTVVLNSKWAVDQLLNNAVNVHLGRQVMEYIKLADGSYAPPPGVTTELIDNGDGTYTLHERFDTQMDFDTNGRITNITDVDGNNMFFTYSGDVLTKVEDAFARSLSFTYSGSRLSSVSDSTGRGVSYSYDANGDLISYTDCESKVWGYGYDAEHRITSLTNPLGITTITNTYDNLGRVITQTAPRQKDTTADYNFYFSGFRNVEEAPDGSQTVYYYDGKGNPVGEENTLGHRSRKKLDGQNHVVESIDPRGNKTTYAYDGNHNLISAVNALNKAASYTYDVQSRLTDIKDPLGHIMHMDYDAEHHLILTTDAEGNEMAAAYYANGLKETSADGRGITTALTYDANGHLETSRVGSHPQISYTYDTIGRMTSLTDQAGSTTSFEYDHRGLPAKITDPLGKETTFVYDAAGQLTSVTDRNGDTVTYAYTPTGKVEKITFPGPSTVNFTYDALDNLIGMQDSLGTTTYTYDAANRLTSAADPHGFTVSYAYDEAGNLTALTYPGNKVVSYTYDALNRRQTVTNWLGQTAAYTYDKAGRLTRLTNFNGTITAYGYDAANRLISLENKKSSGSIISSYSFELDANGNRTQVTENEPLASTLKEETIAYAYTSEGNRLQTADASTYAWDKEGQLSNINGETFSFDPMHRLLQVTGTSALQYAYDGADRRLKAMRDGVTTRYIYDAAGNLLAEANSANVITRYYIHGAGLLALITPDDKTYCYHYNAIGSTVAVSGANEAVINKYTYTPFGEVANHEETLTQPFKFVGRYGVMTEPNGFYYMRARYYDPEVGRFVSEDPLGFEAGDVNFYVYCRNNPINFIDPNGLWGVFGGATLRGTVPLASAEASGKVIIGTEGDRARAALSGNISGTMIAGGGAIGRGFEGGFFLNDVSDFMDSNAINIDTPIGGLSIYLDNEGNFEGLAIGGPSFGLGVSAIGSDIDAGIRGNIDIFNTNSQK